MDCEKAQLCRPDNRLVIAVIRRASANLFYQLQDDVIGESGGEMIYLGRVRRDN